MKKLVMLARVAAWLAVLTIIVLSVVPGKMRPHVLGNDFAEHFLAYFTTASLFASGYEGSSHLLSSGVLLATSAGLLEIVQLWVPGRNADIREFAASMLAAWLGLFVVSVVRFARERLVVVSNS
jgi:VanZ family protein